jgi:hypothetical protein
MMVMGSGEAVEPVFELLRFGVTAAGDPKRCRLTSQAILTTLAGHVSRVAWVMIVC